MRKGLKITLYIFFSILLLVLGSLVFLNSRWGQNFVRGKVETYLRSKLKTEVHLGYLGYGFPKFVVLKDVLLLDQVKDTLLAAGEVKLDLNMLALFHKELILQQILLSDIHAHIYRNQTDTSYNFSYIIQAFSSPAPAGKAKDTSASSFKMEIDRIKLDDIHLRYDDHAGGILFGLNLSHSDISIKKIDFSKLFFHIKDMSAEGLQTTISQDSSWLPKKPDDTSKTDFQLVADNVNLKQVRVDFNSSLSKISFAMNAGNVQLALNRFGLVNSLIDVKKLLVYNSDVSVTLGKRNLPASGGTAGQDTSVSWQVRANDVTGNNLNFIMDDNNSAPVPAGIDYSHLNIKNGFINVNNFYYNGDTTRAIVNHFTGKEKSGIDIKELRTAFNYNQQGAELNNLYFKTPYTLLQNHLGVHYPSLAAFYKNMQLLQLSINLKNSTLGINDLLVFVPELNKMEQFSKMKNEQLKLDADISGHLDELIITHLDAVGLKNTELLMSGKLGGLPEYKKLSYNLNIAKFQSSANDISPFLPDSVKSMVRLPDRFGAIGQLAGNMQDVKTEMYLMSSDGMAYAKGRVATSPGKNREQYDLLLRATGLNLGKILKKDSLLGMVTATIIAKGTGFDIKTMTADIDGAISSAEVKGYRYHDIKLSGKVQEQKGKVDFLSVDTNLQMQFTAQADFSGKYASAKGDVKLDSIDFRALKLYSSYLRTRGVIHFDFPVLNPDYPQGTFMCWKPVINAGGRRYYLDSMYITSHPSQDTGQNIVANLDILQAAVTGKTPLTKIWPILQEHINRHYKFHSPDSAKSSIAALKQHTIDTTRLPTDYGLNIQAHIIDKPMLHGLLPGLTSFDSIHLDALLSPDKLVLNLNAPDIVYGSTTITNAQIAVNGADSAFTYKVTADKITQNSMELWYTNIHGNLDQDSITASISLSDEAKKERFALAATILNAVDSQIIRLNPGLKLDYKVWDVAQPNKIVFSKGGCYVQNFQISNNGQSIKAGSSEARINSPLRIDIASFQISDITDAISHNDTLLAGGVLAGSITIDQISPEFKITGDLGIQQLSILGDTLGNMKLLVNNKQDNVLDTKITLLGQGNDLALNGSYFLKQSYGNDFDFNLDVNALALHSFESVAQNQIRNSSGFLRGKLNAKGTLTAPVITGGLTTDKLVTTLSQLNAEFKMTSEKIEFTTSGLSFSNFTIHDSADNKAVFNGSINTTDFSSIGLNMKVAAKNWRALNSTSKDNKTFYGKLLLTADLDIKGTATAPTVEGSMKILKGTNVTFVNPETAPELQASKGIVEFVNMKDTGRGNFLPPKARDTVKHKMKVGADFNVNISVDKTAQFSLVVDQASGDFLSVKGDATLNATVTPGGTMSLAGSYEIHEGSYQLNYNFIKRKFIIKDGSIITFAGDPVTGTNLDITASYEAQVAPYDLMQREITDATLNYYKQQLPFHVDLHMNGEMMKPLLTFDVVLPENKVYPISPDLVEMIQGKLNQVRLDTSELNKQVFAVLILNRFVSDDPFSSGAANSPSFIALQSASTFIGEQLNQAAGKLIKGVDFSVNLAETEDYTSGNMQQRTDLNLAASKQLLNNRLKLTIGNDFELQGPQTANNQNSAIPTNLAADYLITEDGKYSVRGYRKVYDEGILEGFVTETGFNFIVNLNYNHFKEVFKKKKKVQEDSTHTKKAMN